MSSTNPTSQTPASQPESLHDHLAEAEAAMQGAMKAPPPRREEPKPEAPKAPAPGTRPAAIRGPRVVQAGREHRTGKVVSVGPTDLFIEFGPKELGILPRLQFSDEADLPKVGDSYEVVIDKFEAAESLFVCSRPGAVQKAAWEMLEPGTVIEARVTGVVNGKDGKQAGLELEVSSHRAFMPASQVGVDRIPDLSVLVGEKVRCAVVRVERAGKGNIILSRRDVLDAERKEQGEKLLASLAEGQTLEGVVRKIMPFGAFVDLGGVDGLVHVGDLSYERVNFGEKSVERHVKEGQRVTVKVLKIEPESKRISLGLKQVQGDPFATAANAITEGAEVTGKITRLAEFGAFCELAPGVEGLIHISELDHKRIARVDDAVKPDQIVQVKVLKVDPGSRRVSLSIKALKPLPEISIGAGAGGKGGGRKGPPGRSAEEILKETPALRRMREKFKNANFKGGIM